MDVSLNEWVSTTPCTRKDSYAGQDRELFLDLGYFMAQFAIVELTQTNWLQVATQSQDLESFDILVRGMDAKVKVDRLRKAMKRYGSIGPNLAARFDVFEQQAIKLRNKLSHNGIAPSSYGDDPTYQLVSVLNQHSEQPQRSPNAKQPEKIKASRIWGMGLWLNVFANDLSQLKLTWIFQSLFEITEPRSPVLLASRE